MISLKRIINFPVFLTVLFRLMECKNDMLYQKVSNLLPVVVIACDLKADISQVSFSHFACLNHCSTLAKCSLICTNGKICKFYSAAVSNAWKSDNGTSELTDFQCFSNFYIQNVLNDNIETLTASSEFPSFELEKAFNGFYCSSLSEDPNFFHSNISTVLTNNWVKIILNDVYLIQKIVVHVRAGTDPTPYFSNIQVRVGLSTDITKNGVFGFDVGGVGTFGKVVVFGSEEMVGSTISIQTLDLTHLCMADVKIIGKLLNA